MIKEQQKNEVNIINNENNESSFENMNGEEEDEDDLLKSESETNKSTNKSLKKDKGEENPKNNEELITSNNKNINNISNNIQNLIKSLREDNLKKSEELKESKIEMQRRSSGRPIERKTDEEESEIDELENEDEEGEESEDSDPYEIYLESETMYKNIFDNLESGDCIYGIKSNIFYIYLYSVPFKKNNYIFIKALQPDLKEKILNLEKIINNDANSRENKRKIYKIIREKIKSEEIILINKNNMKDYTFNKKVKVHYLNYFDKKITVEIPVNINCKLIDFVNYIKKLYHIPDITNNTNISILSKNKKFSGKDFENEEYFFRPPIFDYEKDYILFIEHENFDIITLDLGSSLDKHNFKEKQVPHILFSSHNNLSVESILVSKQLEKLECEIYIFRDEYYFNLESNVGKNNYEKAKNAISSYNWKNKCNYITTIKTMKSTSYKHNEDVLSFSIWPRFNLLHDKTYIFLISTPYKNINVFDSGVGDQGLFIISGGNKAIINGIVCKKISDFSVEN